MSYLNFESGSCLLWLVDKLLRQYPEPMVPAICVCIDYEKDPFTSIPKLLNMQKIKEMMQLTIGTNSTHLKFIRALEYLLDPD